MPRRQIGHYEVQEQIGEGSFGEVYRARDLSFDRTVVIKTLKARFVGFGQVRARFQREAEAISAIDHPNVVTLYEFIREGDSLHLVMQWVDGRSLRQRQAEGPIEQAEIVRITGEIAAGLQAAHERGVVHRDLKPANVLLTSDGRCKIVDFGLAHFGERTTLARESDLLGTPAYMAPEQQIGGLVDARTDIYALGLILQEMLERLPAPSRRLQKIARRATRHVPAERYQTAAEFGAALEGARALPAWTLVLVLVAVIGAVAGPRVDRWMRPGTPEVHRILVAPFENNTRSADLDWLSTALMDNFMGVLGQMPGYRLVSRESISSAVQLASARTAAIGDLRLRDLAEDVSVDFVVTGSYARHGQGLRINTSLENFREGEVIASWPRDLEDVEGQLLASVDEIGREIAGALGVELAAADEEAVPPFHTTNISALRQFEEGMLALQQDRTGDAVADFRAAVAIDSAYARAWLYLWRTAPDPDVQTDAIRRAMHYRHGTPPPLESLIEAAFAEQEGTDEEAIARYEQILAGYPDQPFVHNSLAALYLRERRYLDAVGEFEATRTLNPFDYSFAGQLALTYLEVGRADAALELLVDWHRERPQDDGAARQLARVNWLSGRYDEALAWCDSLAAVNPGADLAFRSVVYRYQGRMREAARALEEWGDQREGRYMRAMDQIMLADLDRVRGRLDSARQKIDGALASQDNYYSRWVAGLIAVARGELDDADVHAQVMLGSVSGDVNDTTVVDVFGRRRFYCDLAGRIALARGEVGAALRWHRLARRYSSRLDADTFLPPLGEAALAAGDSAAARRAFEGALVLNVNSGEPLLALGRLALDQGAPERARAPLERLDRVWSAADPDAPGRLRLDTLLTRLERSGR